MVTLSSRPRALPPSVAPSCGWREFCELHASTTAREFAQHYWRFVRERPVQDVVPPESFFSKQFSALFQHHFSCEGWLKMQNLPWATTASLAAHDCPLRITSFSGVLDYRETVRPGSDSASCRVGTQTRYRRRSLENRSIAAMLSCRHYMQNAAS